MYAFVSFVFIIIFLNSGVIRTQVDGSTYFAGTRLQPLSESRQECIFALSTVGCKLLSSFPIKKVTNMIIYSHGTNHNTPDSRHSRCPDLSRIFSLIKLKAA